MAACDDWPVRILLRIVIETLGGFVLVITGISAS